MTDAAFALMEEQNRLAERRIRLERLIGLELLDARPEHPLPDGVDAVRAGRAVKLARIEGDVFESFIANTIAAGRELTMSAALKLAPVQRREASRSTTALYTAPPVDVQLARVLGMQASDARTDWLERELRRALAAIENPKHRRAWMLANGITDDGEVVEPWPISKVAAHMGVSNRYAGDLYLRGYVPILEALLRASLEQQRRLMAQM